MARVHSIQWGTFWGETAVDKAKVDLYVSPFKETYRKGKKTGATDHKVQEFEKCKKTLIKGCQKHGILIFLSFQTRSLTKKSFDSMISPVTQLEQIFVRFLYVDKQNLKGSIVDRLFS